MKLVLMVDLHPETLTSQQPVPSMDLCVRMCLWVRSLNVIE